MSGLNEATLIGRLGKDPELSYTQSGAAKCKFSLATSEKYADRSGDVKEETEWHNIIVWGKQAENCDKYLSKGALICVKGKIQTRSWDDQQSGQKKYITEIKAFKVIFIDTRSGASSGGGQGGGGQGGRNRDGGGQGGGQPPQDGASGYGPQGDDIPF